MFRRNFLQSIGLLAVNAPAGTHKTVTYAITGFTCVTCAVGLDTLLQQQKGVVRSRSSYPERKTVIEYDQALVTEKSLKGFIAEMGFQAIEA